MKIKLFFLLLFLLTSLNLLFSQTREIKSLRATAEMEFYNNNYYGATKLLIECYNLDKRQHDVILKIAEYARLDNDYITSAKYYKILCDKYPSKYPDAFFYYAQMLKSNEEFLKAQFYFSSFLKQNTNDTLLKEIAKKEIINCEFAWKSQNRPLPIDIIHCDSSLNSVYSDFAPFILPAGNLIFSSIKPNEEINNFQSKIYIYDSFSSTVFDSSINVVEKEISNLILNKKNNFAYFTITENNISNIYYSKFENNKWENPQPLININIEEYNTTQGKLLENFNNKKYILFSSDRPTGEGGYDIYIAELINDSTVGTIRNIGRPIVNDDMYKNFIDTSSIINTIGNEISPFYDIQDSILYFSSNSYLNMGGYDIFKVKTDFSNWSKIENLGYPINSAQNDLYFTLSHDVGMAYLASNRKSSFYVKEQSCCNDIYRFEIEKNIIVDTIKEKEIIVEKLTDRIKYLIPITLYFDNDYPVPNSWDTVTNDDYVDLFYDYVKKQEKFADFFSSGLQKTEKQIAIDSIDSFFELVQRNYQKLNEFAILLKELLSEGQQINITIKGYTSPLNTVAYNNNLAKRRISSLVNYFDNFESGYFRPYIDKKQIVYSFVAFGKTLSDGKVSDDPNDPRNSIYNPAASRERKIEIIAIEVKRDN